MEKRGLLVVLAVLSSITANAQWRNTKHHTVLSAMAGGSFGLGSPERVSNYQLIGRGMYYWKRPIAFGAEAGFTRTMGTSVRRDYGAINGFAHLKLPLGFYAEGGLGVVGQISDMRTMPSMGNAGYFWSLGFAKSLGPRVAVDLQYRKAPDLGADYSKNLQRGLRFGLSFKL